MPDVRNWILHDYLQVNGGAERLVLTLARHLGYRLGVSGIYPDFTGSGDLHGVDYQVTRGLYAHLPRIARALATFGHGWTFPANTDRVIYSGVYAPLAITRQVRGRKFYYCHTPPRFAFDRQEDYLQGMPLLTRPLLRRLIAGYREAYMDAVRQMDVVITNSVHQRERLLRLTGVVAEVVYPPIDTQRFRFLGQQGYYLSVGRLEPNKRIERIVRAFLDLPDRQLVVASGGSQLQELKVLSAGAANIHFTGWQSDEQLARLMGNAIAVLYVPRDEDFGMSAVEAMAAGKPVIGVDEGGLSESIIHDVTGLLLPKNPTVEAIAAAVERLSGEHALSMHHACESHAAAFTEQRFLAEITSLIE